MIFAGRIGFRATAYAEIGAWTAALLMNTIVFVRILSVRLKGTIESIKV
ncbi:MAG: hypothetical protein IJ053_01350 [Lachnospiraceae bacterium]|nr:hypothetical protein [Lachnospiraceae bacterium]MBQ9609413.1 hypothetical protein [Lachnospiraceae bacterium]